jgi:hypothetical protein
VFFQWLQEIGRPVLYKERQAGSMARQERKAGWMVFTSQSLDAREPKARTNEDSPQVTKEEPSIMAVSQAGGKV